MIGVSNKAGVADGSGHCSGEYGNLASAASLPAGYNYALTPLETTLSGNDSSGIGATSVVILAGSGAGGVIK